MGNLHAAEFAEQVQAGGIDLRSAIRWHLESNFFPAISYGAFGPMAIRAIDKASKGLWEARVKGPKGWVHRKYGATMPVWAVVEELHLEPFVREGD